MSNSKNILLLGKSGNGKTSLAALIANKDADELDQQESFIPDTTIQGAIIEYEYVDSKTKARFKRYLVDCKRQIDLPLLLNSHLKFDAAIWVLDGQSGYRWQDMQQLGLARLFKIPYIAICVNNPDSMSHEIDLVRSEAITLLYNNMSLPFHIKRQQAILARRAQLVLEDEEITEEERTIEDEANKDILTEEQIQALLEPFSADELCEENEASFDYTPYMDKTFVVSTNNFSGDSGYTSELRCLVDSLEGINSRPDANPSQPYNSALHVDVVEPDIPKRRRYL